MFILQIGKGKHKIILGAGLGRNGLKFWCLVVA